MLELYGYLKNLSLSIYGVCFYLSDLKQRNIPYFTSPNNECSSQRINNRAGNKFAFRLIYLVSHAPNQFSKKVNVICQTHLPLGLHRT